MKIRYARWVPATVVTMSAVLLGIGVWLCAIGSYEGGVPVLVAAAVGGLIGWTRVRAPYFVLSDSELTVLAQRGPYKRSEFSIHDRLVIEGNRILLVEPGKRTPLPVFRQTAHPQDWAALEKFLERRRRRSG